MDPVDKLVELRKQAEAAVAGMQDADLRSKAFEVILQHLLAGSSTQTPGAAATQPSAAKRKDLSRVPGSAKSRILLLRDEGFFDSQRSLADVNHELKAHGWIHPQTALSGPLQSFVRKPFAKTESQSGQQEGELR